MICVWVLGDPVWYENDGRAKVGSIAAHAGTGVL